MGDFFFFYNNKGLLVQTPEKVMQYTSVPLIKTDEGIIHPLIIYLLSYHLKTYDFLLWEKKILYSEECFS